MHRIWIIYLAAVNLIALGLYGIDKHKARTHAWRISERMLLGIAIAGGSIGALLGMRLFHHKTRHRVFSYGLPAILALQVLLAVCLLRGIGR